MRVAEARTNRARPSWRLTHAETFMLRQLYTSLTTQPYHPGSRPGCHIGEQQLAYKNKGFRTGTYCRGFGTINSIAIGHTTSIHLDSQQATCHPTKIGQSSDRPLSP